MHSCNTGGQGFVDHTQEPLIPGASVFEVQCLVPLDCKKEVKESTHNKLGNLVIQWNLSNLDTLGTISGVHFIEVS